MSAPTDSDIGFRSASPAKVTDDVTSWGGAPAIDLNEADSDLLFDSTGADPIGGSDKVHRNAFYRENQEGAGGKALGGLVYLVNGIRLIGSAGLLSCVATTNDATKKVIGLGFVSGALQTSTVTLLAGTAVGIGSFDANNFWRAELVASDGVTPTNAVDPIELYIDGTFVGVIQSGLNHATAEYELAVATAKNTNLSAANRLTDPTGIGSWSRPLRHGSITTSLATPDLNDGDYIGIAVRKTLKAGLSAPLSGRVKPVHNFRFVGSA